MNTYSVLKLCIHQHCQEVIQSRIATAKSGMEEVLEFLHNNSKSSAGDKHETSRAMAHLEMENRQAALQHLIKMDVLLKQLDPAKPQTQIEPGALLVTDHTLFYIAISLGKVVVSEQEVLVLSYQAPIITTLKNIPTGSKTSFQGTPYKILHIA